jgi:hypothetical protein
MRVFTAGPMTDWREAGPAARAAEDIGFDVLRTAELGHEVFIPFRVTAGNRGKRHDCRHCCGMYGKRTIFNCAFGAPVGTVPFQYTANHLTFPKCRGSCMEVLIMLCKALSAICA